MADSKRGVGAQLPELDAEAIACTPMLQTPHAPQGGGRRHLSPLEYLAMTHEPRADLDGLGEDFGLYEEPCTTVDKRGVRLFNRWYSHPSLQDYTTGDKRLSQRRLILRYDRALAARGVLDGVQFLHLDEQGVCVDRLLLSPTDLPQPRWSKDEIVRQRNACLSALLKKRSASELGYAALQGGIELQQRLVEDTLARERLQRRTRVDARPAAPIDSTEEHAPRAAALRNALTETAAWADRSTTSTVDAGPAESSVSDAAHRQSQAGESTVAAPAVPEPQRREEQPSSLGELLDGRVGFRSRR